MPGYIEDRDASWRLPEDSSERAQVKVILVRRIQTALIEPLEERLDVVLPPSP